MSEVTVRNTSDISARWRQACKRVTSYAEPFDSLNEVSVEDITAILDERDRLYDVVREARAFAGAYAICSIGSEVRVNRDIVDGLFDSLAALGEDQPDAPL